MPYPDPYNRSLATSLKNVFDKQEDEVLRRILDTQVFTVEPLAKDSHKRKFDEGRRRVFRHWPRDPKGKVLGSEDIPEGMFTFTSTPLWGASLYDFYFVNRIPDCKNYLTISTGSKLAGCMKNIGELANAEHELDWATNHEPDPAVRHASDIGDIIECRELMVMLRACGTSLRGDGFYEDDKTEESGTTDEKDEKMVVDEGPDRDEDPGEEKRANAYTPPKPFDYANYPMPWPLVPFSANSPKLESPIPYHLMPEKLIVHDPFSLLHAEADASDSGSDMETIHSDSNSRPSAVASSSKPDITHTYSLRLTKSLQRTIAQEREEIAEAATCATPIVLLTLWPSPTEGPVNAAVEVTVPPPPPPPSCTPEAHLYLSPAEVIGRGNHSFVYRAEWDLPKSIFFKPTICETCVKEAALNILKRDGKQKEDSASADGPESSRMGRFVKCTKDFPSVSINLVREPDEFQKDPSAIPPYRTGVLKPAQTVIYDKYEGPKTRVHVDSVPWYTIGMDAEPCNHRVSAAGPLPGPAPPSAQVSVVAKLSIPGDPHLAKEAVNYQRFGPHMSEHWTGYTLAKPLIEPTPMGAIVPNFYGYYVKDIEKGDEIVDPDVCGKLRGDLKDKYFSPILLLEDCGTPTKISSMTLDDRRECAALLFRFHHLGWVQGSFYPRNILMQRGDHADFPLMRSGHDRQFRLIDFGRAMCSEDAKNDKEWQAWDTLRFAEKGSVCQTMEFPYPI